MRNLSSYAKLFEIFPNKNRRVHKFFVVFGRVQTRSDAIGCIWVHSDALGRFQFFSEFRNYSDDFDNFWTFLILGAYFSDFLPV